MAYQLILRRDAIRWLRERRAQLYVDLLMQARAEQFYLSVVTGADTARMREVFAETDTRLPPPERARLGANGSVFASPKVRGLYERLFAEAWPVELCPGRFRSYEARLQVLGRPRAFWANWRRRSAANSAPSGTGRRPGSGTRGGGKDGAPAGR